MGLGLQSRADKDLLVDNEALTLATTNIKRLSYLQFEDILKLQVDDQLVLHDRKEQDFIRCRFANIPNIVAKAQRKSKVAGNTVAINDEQFLCIKGRITAANAHHDAKSGGLSLVKLTKMYNSNKRFVIGFAGTDKTMTLAWKDVIELSEKVLLFGPPFDGTRTFECVFHMPKDNERIDRIFTK